MDIPSPNIGWRVLLSTIILWTSIMGVINEFTVMFRMNNNYKLVFYLFLFILSFVYLVYQEKYIQHIL